MKKLFGLLCILFSLFIVILPRQAHAQMTERVIVKFHSHVSSSTRDAIVKQLHVIRKENLKLPNTVVLNLSKGKSAAMIKSLSHNPHVQYVEKDAVAQAQNVPNDPYYLDQWGLQKILAPKAWNTTHGSANTTIAIVDTGIDASHPDMAGKIVARANFTNNPDVDNNGHGTHVAGIAAADTNNDIGIAGTGYNTRLLSVKVLDSTGSGYYSWVADGIIWAADHGAKIINLSLGGTASSQTLQSAVNYAWNKGAVIVAAAGNNRSILPFYPAGYPNVVSVAATNSNDQRAYFSNYGYWVDVAAPGVSILSTYPGGYAYLSGTSMATPFVSGLAGLVAGEHPTWSNIQIVNQIEKTADHIFGTGFYWKYGRIDACAAVDCNTTTVSPTPIPTTTPTPNPTSTPIPTAVPTASPTATPTPNPTAVPTITPTPTAILVPTAIPTPTPIPAPAPSSKPWWCQYIPWYPTCQ